MQKILITGAAGTIGKALREYLKDSQFLLRLVDIHPIENLHENEEAVQADICEFSQIQKAMQDIDCVVHLAAIATEDSWEKILPVNIIGTRNVFEAAKEAHIKRIIFASSNHAVGFYKLEQTLDENVLPRPDTLYGVSKAFGEALGRFYADKYDISVACLRIGSFEKKPSEKRHLRTWISEKDLSELIKRCIEAPAYHYLIVYGVSANKQNAWRDQAASILGYHPQDNAQLYIEHLPKEANEDTIAKQFHGGSFCSINFKGNPTKIE